MSRILPVWGRSGSTSVTAVLELSTFLQKRRCSKSGDRLSKRKGFEWIVVS